MPQGFTAVRPLASHYEVEAMFAAFADLVTLHDLDGTIRLASDSSRTILGLAPDQLVGRRAADTFVLAEDAPLLDAAIEQLSEGNDKLTVTFRTPGSNGSKPASQPFGATEVRRPASSRSHAS